MRHAEIRTLKIGDRVLCHALAGKPAYYATITYIYEHKFHWGSKFECEVIPDGAGIRVIIENMHGLIKA